MESSLLVICWNSKDISLDGLDKELEEHKNYDVHIGSLSSELRSLHEKFLDLGVRLKNRKVANSSLENLSGVWTWTTGGCASSARSSEDDGAE
ncbi:hypothetical protein TRIUR3_21718 [Triticum urartu]|uniref:Uncharacterized protein n=1 Tax=Triticum urartu TaxID=4572 RepID=M7ZV36_TRIUA|nr:hypothetical protein TRIUR3_21718 [Triticum urartu]